ncbi:flagellar M-ring protein FliF [Nostoc sp. HG1]|nr:flagellar M-ring protein FliF [Nostoc sp. HG1]
MAAQEIISASPTFGATSTPTFSSRMAPLRDLASQPAVRKAMPAIAMIGVVGVASLAYFTLQTPTQVPLFQGLADADKAAVAESLQTSGIDYTLDPATGTISVRADAVHQARMQLAGQGLPKALPSGDAVIASLPMGSSRAVEGETLRGAREADLARTIEAIDAVKAARIHLATPEPSVFVREAKPAAASVMLTLQQGRTLSGAQVRAIRHLVASSVPGLGPDAVSIIDQSGSLLSSDQNGGGDDSLFQLQMQMENRYRQAVAALLGPIAGQGNYSVEVHAEVDATESQSTRESFPKDDRALRSEEGVRSSSDASAPAIGIPGALSNQPPPASQITTTAPTAPPATTPATGTSGEESYTRRFDVGREIAVTHQPQGRLRRLSVAVALREIKGAKKRSAAEVTALDNLVKGAVGFDAARGDVVAISSRPFAETAEPAVSLWDQAWFWPVLRQIGGILGAIVVFLFIGRPLLKALKARLAASGERRQIEQQLLSSTGQTRGTSPVTLEMIEAAPSYDTRANLVRSFVRQDPERAALVVRQLMQEGSNA